MTRALGRTGEARQTDARSAGGHKAVLLDYAPCAEGSNVALWRLTGPGHGWPGADSPLPEKIIGPHTEVIEVADEIFRFVPRFSRPDAPPLDAR